MGKGGVLCSQLLVGPVRMVVVVIAWAGSADLAENRPMSQKQGLLPRSASPASLGAAGGWAGVSPQGVGFEGGPGPFLFIWLLLITKVT